MRERLMAAALIAVLSVTTSVAQDKPAGPAAQEKPPAPTMMLPSGGQVPLRVTVVISRLQGDKKIASLPYSFGMLAGERTNLRMGSDVPIISKASSKSGDTASSSNVTYRPVGTNIDCNATSGPGGTYRLSLVIEDSSVHLDPAQKQGNIAGLVSDYPSFRTFRTNFSTLLRDGQTTQHTSATDPVSGEVMRIDVSLSVVK
jgi:hypothetical protein